MGSRLLPRPDQGAQGFGWGCGGKASAEGALWPRGYRRLDGGPRLGTGSAALGRALDAPCGGSLDGRLKRGPVPSPRGGSRRLVCSAFGCPPSIRRGCPFGCPPSIRRLARPT